MARVISYYKNGNYFVKLLCDGTKIKETSDDSFVAEFPDSIDLKITNYCDRGCPMCHEKSSPLGKHAELDAKFLSTLKRGTELAIGGGNPLSHPQLIPFLEKMKKRGIVCNLTVNEEHLKSDKSLVLSLINNKLIYGLGISMQSYNEDAISFALSYPHAVLHLINGVFTDYDKIADKGLKILILGYKKFGRGEDYFNGEIARRMNDTKKALPTLISKFKVVSFDNLALEQLDIKSLLSPKEYEQFYMGDDGEGTMYIDLVKKEFAKSSTSTERYPILDEIIPMFKKIQIIHS